MSTIVAISTATGQGGIGIIRMSGEECFNILNKIFKPVEETKIKGYNIKYGHIFDEKNAVIDEVLVSYFIKPKSYTKENMCEINSHGGLMVEKAILNECIKNGAVLAQPGEFTKRSFLNGRIDLTQAEAVMELISAKSEKERIASANQLQGGLYKEITNIQDELLDLMADIEASIDYPEYDVEETTKDKLKKSLNEIKIELENLNKSYENGKIISSGIETAIVGKPNVGKSSLLNLMLNEDRAIVSDIEGTTRDSIEENININGILLKIIDTAGIRKTSNEIEKIGVKRTIDITNKADLIIFVIDASRALDDEDKKVLELIKNKKAIILLNKYDLIKTETINVEKLRKQYKKEVIKFSTQTRMGLDKLYDKIIKLFEINEIDLKEENIITNIRQKSHIQKALNNTNKAIAMTEKELPIDIFSIDIREILNELANITGQNVSEDVINKIFAKFCLGK